MAFLLGTRSYLVEGPGLRIRGTFLAETADLPSLPPMPGVSVSSLVNGGLMLDLRSDLKLLGLMGPWKNPVARHLSLFILFLFFSAL